MKIISKYNFKEHLRRKFLNRKSTWHIGFVSLFIAVLIHTLYLFVFKIKPLSKGNWDERPILLWVEVKSEVRDQRSEDRNNQ